MKSIRIWSNRHRGADVYVLGAGASLDHFDKAYFADKLVVAVNEVASAWGITPTAIVLKEHRESLMMAAANHPSTPLIVSRWPYGDPARGFPSLDTTPLLALPNLYVFDHLPNRSGAFDATVDWPTSDDSLVVSMSTLTSALHFGALLGAKTLIVVGHDAGQLDDSPYMAGYGKAEQAMGYGVQNKDWLIALEAQSRGVKAQLVERYGCRIYSLSPFLNWHLEGHRFDGGLGVQINLDAA